MKLLKMKHNDITRAARCSDPCESEEDFRIYFDRIGCSRLVEFELVDGWQGLLCVGSCETFVYFYGGEVFYTIPKRMLSALKR